jgi:transposase IS66 family protein
LSSSFISLKSYDPELAKQLKERAPEALFEKLTSSLSIDADRLRFAEYKVRVLEERLRLVRSEKLSDDQLELLELEPGSTAPRSKPKVSASNWNCRLRKRANIPVANNCLQSCRESNRSSAAQLINAAALSAAKKLFSSAMILSRETRIDLSRATLDGWVMQELLAGNYIQADETPVGVQPESARGKNHQAYLWQYSRPAGVVVFDFRMGREREGPTYRKAHRR